MEIESQVGVAGLGQGLQEKGMEEFSGWHL